MAQTDHFDQNPFLIKTRTEASRTEPRNNDAITLAKIFIAKRCGYSAPKHRKNTNILTHFPS